MSEDLPEIAVQVVIGDALHHAVSKLFEPSVLHIAPINTIGCFLLQHLLHGEYRPVCGSVRINAGGATFGLEAKPEEVDAHEYYLWIEAERPDGAVELVDFGTRYWRQWARGMGVLWIAEPAPAPLWTLKGDLPASLAAYEVHPGITAHVQSAIGAAIADRETGSPVETWEKAINDAVDFMANTEVGLGFLVQTGIAEPIEEK